MGNGAHMAAALIGVLALLVFHPGAMSMDRLKANLVLVIAIPLLLLATRFKAAQPAAPRPWPFALLFFWGIPLCLVLSFNSPWPWRLGTEGLGYVLLLSVLILLAQRIAVAGPGRFLPTAWLLPTGGLVGIYALLQAAGIDPVYLENPNRDAVSTLGNTNELAEVMALLIPLSLAGLFSPGRRLFWIAAISIPWLVAALWVSGGRAGALAALCGTAVFLVALLFVKVFKRPRDTDPADRPAPRSRHLSWLAIPLIGLGLVVGGLVGEEKNLTFKRIDSEASIFSMEYPTNKVRIEIWKSTLDLIRDHKLWGVGAGRFRSAFPPYRSPEEAELPGFMGARTEVHHPHNEYLWAAAEGGLPALIFFLLFLVFVIKHCLSRACFARRNEERIFCSGAAGAVIAFAVLSLFRAPLHSPAAAVILFLTIGQALGVPGRDPGMADRSIRSPGWKRLVNGAAFVVVLVLSCWIGARGLASDWIAASTAIKEKLGPDEFKAFQRAADIDPDNLDIINFVGQTAANQLMGTSADTDGRYQNEAVKSLSRVLELNPNHPEALKTLGRIRTLEGDYDEARELIHRYNWIMGEKRRPIHTIVGYLKDAGRDLDATILLATRFETRPKSLVLRARGLLEDKEFEAAQIVADRVLAQEPLNGDALYLLGRCIFEIYGEGEDDAFRLMHIAYALDWIEREKWDDAAGSAERSLRYGEGADEVQYLQAIIEAGKGNEFIPPEKGLQNEAVLERLKEIAAKGKLPDAVVEALQEL